MAVKKSGLGRGFDAIFADNSVEDISVGSSTTKVKLLDIEPNREQPRKQFDEDALAELSDSIAQHGVLQPLLVRPMPDGGYQLVAGERRWRASRMAGLTEVPVVIRDLTDSQVAELALVENLQRENLNPLEEANGYKELSDKFGYTQEKISEIVGKSRPSIANALRLLNLPEDVQEMVREQAIRVYTAVGAQGLSRVDFFATYEDNRVVFNEINTIPGFTSISMYPKLFGASGIPYRQLIDLLIQLAQEACHEA